MNISKENSKLSRLALKVDHLIRCGIIVVYIYIYISNTYIKHIYMYVFDIRTYQKKTENLL